MDLQGAFHVYDTTLRDGAQQEGLNLSVADKLTIARQLDELGVGFIEGGWPGSNPKDTEFFARARDELDLRHARLTAFGATRRAGVRAADDPLVAALRDSGAAVVTLVAKSHPRHVELALRTTLAENLAMVHDTVAHLVAEGQQVFLDAEHFFDGYRADRDYALEVLRTAYDAGADVAALCDTNGGMLPGWVAEVVHDVVVDHLGPGRHPLPQRHRLRGRQHAGRGRGRRHPRAGHDQRLRRAHRQRRPDRRRRQPPAQARPAGAAPGPAGGGHPDRARRRRGHQRAAGLAAALRRRLGVRAQGGAARQRDQGRPRPLPAHGPGRRRQRHAPAGQRHGRPRLDRAQGPRARLRPLRRPRPGRPGHRAGQGDGGTRLHLRGRRRVVRAAAGRGGRRPAPVLPHRRVVAGDHRDPRPLPARARRRSPRRP